MLRILVAGALALALAACVHRDDGMGQLYKGVACVQEGKC